MATAAITAAIILSDVNSDGTAAVAIVAIATSAQQSNERYNEKQSDVTLF